MRRLVRRGFWVLVIGLFTFALLSPASGNVEAATACTVTTTADGGAGSLRACLADASVQTIDMTGVSGTITLTSGDLLMKQAQTVTITGPGASMLAIDGNGNQSIFELYDGRNTLTVTDVTLQHGYASVEAMYAGTASLIRCVVSNAPVVINQGGHINLTQSSLSGNIYYDNGIWLGASGATVTDSTISNNHVGIAIDNGGGSAFGLPLLPGGNVTVTNSTIAGNQLDGISLPAGSAQVKGSTIARNYGPGIFASGSGTATVTNTIIAGNAQDISSSGNVSGNTNLIGDGSGINGTGNITGDPLLDTDLRDNSAGIAGFLGTPTYALLPGSPAAGKGDLSVCAAAPQNGADQRGVSHATYGCDIGAFQSRGFAISLPATGSGDGQHAAAGQPFANPLIATVTSAAGDPVAGGLAKFTAVPANTASATLSGNPAGQATIGTAGSGAASTNVQVTATANGGRGAYTITANVAGATSGAVSYTLTNVGPAHAAYIVDSNGDGAEDANQCPVGGAGSTGTCTLRDALAAATSGTDTITFKSGLVGPINLTATLTVMTSITINGPTTSALAIDGGSAVTLVTVGASTVNLTITDLTLQHGANSVTMNSALDNLIGGTVQVTRCIFAANANGGYAYTIASGGGGSLTVTQSSLVGNDIAIGGLGGPVSVLNSTIGSSAEALDMESADTVTITGTTITGSTNGGIYFASAAATITSSTITNNTNYGIFSFGTLTLTNSIVAGNGGADVLALSITANNDLVGDGGAIAPSNTIPPGNGNLLGTSAHPLNPLLDTTLRANGAAGGTTTLALLPGSPAIGAGGAGGCGVPDARGVARPAANCDMGPFQSRTFTVAVTSGDSQSAAISQPFSNPLVATVTGTAGDPVAGGALAFTAPVSGAAATFSGTPPGTVTIGAAGSGATSATAQITATANGTAGTYAVNANPPGAAGSGVNFNLHNTGLAGSITVNTGTTPQSAPSGATFVTPLAATVKDSSNSPLSGISVTFAINPVAGAGASFPGNLPSVAVVTDASGVATAPALTAGTTAGNYTVTANLTPPATALTPAATFALTNQAGTATSLVVTTSSTTVVAGAAIDVTVTALDAHGNTATGYAGTIRFASSDPLISPGSGLPNDYTFTTTGPTPDNGVHVFTGGVTLKSAGPAQFVKATDRATSTITGQQGTIAVTAGAARGATPVAGTTPQSAQIGHALANPLSVTVTDMYGNPVGAGVGVTYVVPATGPTGSFVGGVTTANTDGAGVATPPAFTTNTTAGGYTVTASVSGGTTSASFLLTNTAGSPGSVTATGGTPQTVAAGSPFPVALTALVKDASGNVVTPGTSVTFAVVAAGNGAGAVFATSATPTTDTNGIATVTVTANHTAGTYQVTAIAAGAGAPAVFQLTNGAGAATVLSAAAGSGQVASIGTAFPTRLAAKVTDSFGNGVSGVTVTFAVPASGASGSFAGGVTTATTDATGVATASAFTANTTAGGYSATASAGGVTGNAVFTLTNTPGPATRLGVTTVSTASASSRPQSPQPSAQAMVGLTASFTITALDQYGNVATGYTGTVHFTSSDPQATLPPDARFTAADRGVKTVVVTFKTLGTQSLGATDTSTPSIAGTLANITVSPAVPPAPAPASRPSPPSVPVNGGATPAPAPPTR